eukprot:2504372-Karenia_brevis.AAC.1
MPCMADGGAAHRVEACCTCCSLSHASTMYMCAHTNIKQQNQNNIYTHEKKEHKCTVIPQLVGYLQVPAKQTSVL